MRLVVYTMSFDYLRLKLLKPKSAAHVNPVTIGGSIRTWGLKLSHSLVAFTQNNSPDLKGLVVLLSKKPRAQDLNGDGNLLLLPSRSWEYRVKYWYNLIKVVVKASLSHDILPMRCKHIPSLPVDKMSGGCSPACLSNQLLRHNGFQCLRLCD
jgi:hypothetical protein